MTTSGETTQGMASRQVRDTVHDAAVGGVVAARGDRVAAGGEDGVAAASRPTRREEGDATASGAAGGEGSEAGVAAGVPTAQPRRHRRVGFAGEATVSVYDTESHILSPRHLLRVALRPAAPCLPVGVATGGEGGVAEANSDAAASDEATRDEAVHDEAGSGDADAAGGEGGVAAAGGGVAAGDAAVRDEAHGDDAAAQGDAAAATGSSAAVRPSSRRSKNSGKRKRMTQDQREAAARADAAGE